jgi:hypothetical protein
MKIERNKIETKELADYTPEELKERAKRIAEDYYDIENKMAVIALLPPDLKEWNELNKAEKRAIFKVSIINISDHHDTPKEFYINFFIRNKKLDYNVVDKD